MPVKIVFQGFLAAVYSTESHLPKWNGLRVRFDMFEELPRTESAAIAKGFVKRSECEENPKFRGKQYMKDGDTSVILLFDANGYISGIQAGIPKGLPNKYPSQEIRPPFVDDGNQYKLTAYFVDPLLICKRGRSEQQFRLQGTGTDLFIQNGDNPEQDLFEIDLEEANTNWLKGKCFPKMGFHYFRDLTVDMRCETFFPVALLYYNGYLKGFVWSFGALLNSTLVPYEKPEPEFFDNLMEEVPTCLKTLRRSTLHIYLEDKPERYTCKDETSGAGVSSDKKNTVAFVRDSSCLNTFIPEFLSSNLKFGHIYRCK